MYLFIEGISHIRSEEIEFRIKKHGDSDRYKSRV